MKPIKIRYSLIIIVSSLIILYLGGNVLINKFYDRNHKDDFTIITVDEDKNFSSNLNYRNATDAFNKKDYELAIEELKEEINKYPSHAQAYFLLGRIYEDIEFQGGKYYSRMLNNYERYIELKPKGKRIEHVKLRVAQYYIKEGLAQQNTNYLNKAEKHLKSLDQNNGDVKMALGAIYLDYQNYDQAIAQFEKSANLSLSELKLKYNSLGLAYIKKGMYAKAEKILEIAVKIDPKDKYAHNNLGFVYAQQGKLNNAKVHFEEALKLDPTYRNAEKNLQWVKDEITKK
ncbi:MAG: tetratricopeptide repeat protein [Nitrospirae bacterium]|nr:tetratricopeptide repeat protein [Nitrospirota bacterium]